MIQTFFFFYRIDRSLEKIRLNSCQKSFPLNCLQRILVTFKFQLKINTFHHHLLKIPSLLTQTGQERMIRFRSNAFCSPGGTLHSSDKFAPPACGITPILSTGRKDEQMNITVTGQTV